VTSKPLCPFCSHELDESLYNSLYGCDTGCEYVRIEIKCPKCKKTTWDSGEFGHYDNKNGKKEYRAIFYEKFAQWLEQNAPERISDE
jgi:phage FluMu protein Com